MNVERYIKDVLAIRILEIRGFTADEYRREVLGLRDERDIHPKERLELFAL